MSQTNVKYRRDALLKKLVNSGRCQAVPRQNKKYHQPHKHKHRALCIRQWRLKFKRLNGPRVIRARGI